MANASVFNGNVTKESFMSIKTSDLIRLSFLMVMVAGAFIFFCLTVTMLHIIFTAQDLRFNARYILLAFMLINDSLYLILCFCLYMPAVQAIPIPMPLCFVLYTVTVATFIGTLYYLAAMSFECYIAICLPFRHCVICTPQRAMQVVVAVWVVSAIPYVVESVIIEITLKDPLHTQMVCFTTYLLVNTIQTIIRLLNLVLCFTFVGLTILFSYIKIMSVAFSKNSQQTSSASKAGKTVLIHGVQLFLCMCSLLSNLAEVGLGKVVDFLPVCNFIVFTYLPRFLSPLIYGIRDAALSKHIRKHLPTHLKKKDLCINRIC